MLKPLLPKFCFDLSVRLRDIAEKQVPLKLKPIVVWNIGIHAMFQKLPLFFSVFIALNSERRDVIFSSNFLEFCTSLIPRSYLVSSVFISKIVILA